MTVTEASVVGVRPVRASVMWSPRRCRAEVAIAPLRIGTTAASLSGSCGSSMPIRQSGESGVGDVTGHVTAGGQAVVRVRQLVERVRGAFDRPALHHSTRVQSVLAPYVERTAGLHSGTFAQLEDFGDLGRTVRDGQLAAVEAGDVRVRAVGAEDTVARGGSRARSAQACAAASSSVWRPRRARLIGIPITWSTYRRGRVVIVRLVQGALQGPDVAVAGDRGAADHVDLALCACVVSSIRIGSA